MENGIKSHVAVGVITAIVLGGLTLLWNWGSNGGVVRLLGGVTHSELGTVVDGKLVPVSEQVKAALRVGTEIIPAPGGNGQSKTCPEGSVMVGFLFQADSGGPHGIISWVSPVCRTMGK